MNIEQSDTSTFTVSLNNPWYDVCNKMINTTIKYFWGFALCSLLGIWGCGNKESKEENASETTSPASASDASYWLNRLVRPEKLSPFVQDVGWQSYYNRNFQDTIRNASGVSLARYHLEHSSVYRQALLMHSNATKMLYTEYKSDEDPVQHQYFLAVAYIILGEYEKGKNLLDSLPEDPILKGSVEQWKSWLGTDKKSPPELSGFSFSDENTTINQPPRWNETTYAFSLPDGSFYEPSESTTLWLLAKWHEKQATDLLKDTSYSKDVIEQWLAPWRLPFESSFSPVPSKDILPLTDEWLLFGFYLDAADLAFASAISSGAIASLKEFSKKSLLAQEIGKCMTDSKLNTECLVDASMALEERMRVSNKEQTKDIPVEQLNAELLFETFPSFARYSLLRLGAMFALHNEQTRDSGILQLMIREASGPIRDPVFLTFFSAWDAGNGATLRAQDLIHEMSSEFSPLQSARVPLDFLHIRLGRNAVPSGASH